MGIRIFVAGASLTIVAAMAIALGIYFRVIPVPTSLLGMFARTRQPEFSARYYPPDTVAYTWITLAPRGRHLRHMRDIWETFNEYPGFVSTVEDWKNGFAEETGISFDEDIASWIGPTMSAGLLDIDGADGRPIVAAVVAVRNEDVAADFLNAWIGYASAKDDAEFVAGTYQEHATWISEGGNQAYALTDDWLVFAPDEKTLHTTIDRIDGRVENSLARTAKFRAARGALSEPRFASGYLDYEGLADRLDSLAVEFAPIVPGLLGSTVIPGQTAEWVAASATWVDRGLVTEWVTPSGSDNQLNVADLEDPAALLPADTLGFVAASFDPNLDNWRAAVAEQRLSDVLPGTGPVDGVGGMLPGLVSGDEAQLDPDASLAEVFDSGLELVRETTGIDLETEFFDHLEGTAILALPDFDIAAVREDPAENQVDAVMMLSYEERSRDDLSETMSRVTDLAQAHAGIGTEQVDVGAESPATVFDLSVLGMLTGGETGYRPGYVLHDQYLTVGTTERALSTAVGSQNGEGENLSADAEYRRARVYLPATRQIVGYVDGHGVIRRLSAEDLGLETDEYEVIRDATGILVFGTNAGEVHNRGVAIITLFPE